MFEEIEIKMHNKYYFNYALTQSDFITITHFCYIYLFLYNTYNKNLLSEYNIIETLNFELNRNYIYVILQRFKYLEKKYNLDIMKDFIDRY